MAADPERAAAIEGSIARTLRYAADEFSSGPDRVASKLGQATTQLDSSDAKEHLSPESIAKFRAQIAELQKQVDEAERKEKADRIERDVKRFLSNLADEIQSNGSQIDSYFERAEIRLTKDDVRECMTPESIAAFQSQLAELGAKIGRGAPPTQAAPAPPSPSVPASSAPAASAPPPSPPAPGALRPAPQEDSEEAQRTKSSIDRTLRFAEGDIDSPGWRQIESKLGQAGTQIDGAAQLLSASTLDGFRARLAALQTKFDANDRAEKAEEIENWLKRLVRDAEEHVDWADRIGDMLEKVTDVLEKEDTKKFLPAERADFYRKEVARIEAKAGGSYRQKAIDDATAPLEELERTVKDSSFEGLSEYEAQKVWGGFETLKDRVGYALEKLDGGDATARDIRARLDAVMARRSAAYGATRQKDVMARVSAAWEATLKEIAGWENETQDTSAAALGEALLPNTRTALRKLRDVLEGSGLFSPIPEARKEFANDPLLVKIVKDGDGMIDAALAKMTAAFDRIMDAAEQMPTPTGEFELRKASAMAQTAREAFEGTPHSEPRVARAQALDAMWESTLERVLAETKAYYDKLTAEAALAWPKIAKSIKAEDGFNPMEPSWRGKTVRINGFRNRVSWDFGGDYHLSIWVNATPVAGDFEPNVLTAFQTAQHHGRMAIDDHTDWDAIVEIGGPGKVRQRVKTTVKKDGKTIGEIEEMRPVDCVMCRVIALRAGPVAVGPA